MKEVVTKKADDGTTIINEYDTKWIQKDSKDIGKIIKDGKTVFEAWDLARWKQYLQNNEGPVPDGLATPYALQKATSVAGLFSDNSSKFYTGKIPVWRFENATSLANFNRGNTNTTGHVIIDAPKCTNFNYAFEGCTGITEVTILSHGPNPSWNRIFSNCSKLKKVNFKNDIIYGTNFGGMFHNTKIGGNYIVNANKAIIEEMFYQINKTVDEIIANPLYITINFEDNAGALNASRTFWTINSPSIKVVQLNNFRFIGGNYAYTAYGRPAEKFIINFAPFTLTSDVVMYGLSAGSAHGLPNICSIEFNFDKETNFGNYGFKSVNNVPIIYNSSGLNSFYSNKRMPFISLYSCFAYAPYITQADFDYSKCTDITNFIKGTTRFDLESVQKMAGIKNDKADYSAIGFPVTDTAKTLNIGIAARRLYKKFDPKYDRYDTGKTQYDTNGNILYLKADGTTTTTASQAPLNDYIITSPGDRIDITTVEDAHTITNYNNYYLYVASLQYITGDMLEAVRALMDKGYTVTVKFN